MNWDTLPSFTLFLNHLPLFLCRYQNHWSLDRSSTRFVQTQNPFLHPPPYCLYKKSWPISYSISYYNLDQDFLDIYNICPWTSEHKIYLHRKYPLITPFSAPGPVNAPTFTPGPLNPVLYPPLAITSESPYFCPWALCSPIFTFWPPEVWFICPWSFFDTLWFAPDPFSIPYNSPLNLFISLYTDLRNHPKFPPWRDLLNTATSPPAPVSVNPSPFYIHSY